MKTNIKLLIISIIILLAITAVGTYSYFTANVVSNDINEVDVSSGSINLKIDDSSITSNEISPIYDSDYEMLAYNKDFEIISDSTLNTCAKLYLHVNEISDSLKSKYFKYKIVSEGIDIDGDFVNAKNEEDMLLLDKIYLESKSTKYFDLYLWVSYQDDVDQMDLLGTKIDAHLVVSGVDSKEEGMCK